MKKGVPTISQDDAQKCWDAHIDGKEVNLESVNVEFDGSISSFEMNLLPLYQAINEIYDSYKEYSGHNAGEIDAQLVEPCHQSLIKFKIGIENNPGFWLWLNNCAFNGHFSRFIKWRHPPYTRKINKLNWGIGSFTENISYFTRIWKRGELMFVHDEPKGNYFHATRGTSEIWRLKLLKKDYADREFIRALLDTVYGIDSQSTEKSLKGDVLQERIFSPLKDYLKTGEIPESNYSDSYKLLQDILSKTTSLEEIEKTKEDFNNLFETNKSELTQEDMDQYLEWKLTKARSRKIQNEFRTKVIENCKYSCVVTREVHVNGCQACHIKDLQDYGPFSDENGLLMRSDIHYLYDRGHILINKKGILSLNENVRFDKKSNYWAYNNTEIYLPPNINRDYLDCKYNKNKNNYTSSIPLDNLLNF